MARAQLAGRVRGAGVVGPCLPRPGRGTRPYSDSAASTANARPTATRTAPSASRNVRSDARPVAFAPSHAPGIAPGPASPRVGASRPPAPPHRWRRRPGRCVPYRQVRTCSDADVHWTARSRAGIRSVPRITPTAPPIRPITNPKAAAGQARTCSRGTRSDRPKRKVDPAPQEHCCDQREERGPGRVVGEQRAGATAPAIDGGAIQASTRRSTRPARQCAAAAPDPAAAAQTAISHPRLPSCFPPQRVSTAAAVCRARVPASTPREPAANDPAKPRRRRRGVQSVRATGRRPAASSPSSTRARAVAVRARMNRRSERRLR